MRDVDTTYFRYFWCHEQGKACLVGRVLRQFRRSDGVCDARSITEWLINGGTYRLRARGTLMYAGRVCCTAKTISQVNHPPDRSVFWLVIL